MELNIKWETIEKAQSSAKWAVIYACPQGLKSLDYTINIHIVFA